MPNKVSAFTISLDFELYWGLRDVISLKKYERNLIGVWDSLPLTLDLFKKYKIQATWAIVGALFAESPDELETYLSDSIPYENKTLDPIQFVLQNKKLLKKHTRCFFALDLIKVIQETPGQEIGTHTFWHSYSLEAGQTEKNFVTDLNNAIKIAAKSGINLKSIVFPRNQNNVSYEGILIQNNISGFRGNRDNWAYRANNHKNNTILSKRTTRFLDTYIPIFSPAVVINQRQPNGLVNMPASRFLQPYRTGLRLFENQKIKRILDEMTLAATAHQSYHLWWHPHNFGINIKKNLKMLEEILIHYQILNQLYGMESLNMSQVSSLV